MYCEKCRIVFEANCCPGCGNQRVREPKPNDPCFLTEKGVIWAGMLEDMLRQNGIPFLTKKALGAGLALKVGPMSERISLYVPFSRLQDSVEIVNAVFSDPSEGG